MILSVVGTVLTIDRLGVTLLQRLRLPLLPELTHASLVRIEEKFRYGHDGTLAQLRPYGQLMYCTLRRMH